MQGLAVLCGRAVRSDRHGAVMAMVCVGGDVEVV